MFQTDNINKTTEIIKKIDLIRTIIKEYREQGKTIGFVPTMGALHIGHESLIQQARKKCDTVIVSIFVNPIQFGPNEDFNKYPRQLDNDKVICSKHNVDIIFAPDCDEMYPDINNITMVCPPESYKNKLCGITRRGHFDGVATVVLKLFNIIQPDYAFFGQKDAQQLIIIKKMCQDLNLPVKIVPCPIIRDEDGLACSSRNLYLSEESRKKALCLNLILKNIEKMYRSGICSREEILSSSLKLLHSDVKLEYLEIYDLNTLSQQNEIHSNCLVAIAGKIDGIRLIDNIIIEN